MAKIAVIETGGKQYLVEQGSIVQVETLEGATKAEDAITFDKVLLIDDGATVSVGTPYVSGAKVSAQLVELGRTKKVIVLRYRPKSRYQKKKGHRQPFAKMKITKLG